MNLGKLLLLFVVGLLLVGSAFAFTNDVDTLGVVVTPFDDDGSVSFLTDFSYRFDFTNALNCSGVLLSLDESVTTNAYGWSGLDLNISSLDVMTSYVCEYIDGDLNAVRELNPNLFDADTIDTLGCSENQTILYDGGDWVCANSSDWVETAGDSMTGDLYMNANSLTNVSTFNFNVPSSELNLSSTLFASFYPLMALKSAGMGVGGLSDVAGLMNVIGGVDMGGLVSLKDDDAFQTMLLGAYDNAYPLVEDVRTLMAIFNLSDSPAELLSSGLTMRTNFSRYDAGFFVSDSIYTDGDELFYTYYDGGKILSLNDEHDALLPRISWGDGDDTIVDISNADLDLNGGDVFGVNDLVVDGFLDSKTEIAQFHREATITPAATDTWYNISWDLAVANESIGTFYDLNAVNDTFTIVGFEGIVRVQGCLHPYNDDASNQDATLYSRILVNGVEARCLQSSASKAFRTGVADIVPYIGTIDVIEGDNITLQWQTDNTDLILQGSAVFDHPVSASINFEKISSRAE